ncbi:MAG: response regulator, partial [Planctomycetales bacterium]
MPDVIHVLLVEDDRVDAKTVCRGLADCQSPAFHIEHVTSLAAALKTLNNGIAVDVVLLDLGLPDTTGINTVMPVLELHKGPPIVVFTGQDDNEMVDKLLSLGVQDYIVKGTETKEHLQ